MESKTPHTKSRAKCPAQTICKVLFKNYACKKAQVGYAKITIRRRRRVRRRGEKSGAELAPAEEFFIPLKFSGREPLGEQENLQSEESDPSLFTEASALPMR